MKPRNSNCLHLLILLSLVGLLTASILQIELLEHNTTVAAVKGGTCPDTEVESASGNCTEECQSDASCEGVEKCCRMGCRASCHLPNGSFCGCSPNMPWLAFTPLSTSSGKPGLLPCTGGGDPCKMNDKPGACPSLSIGISMLGACRDECRVDSNCPAERKCCQNGCGKLACSIPEF